MRPTKDDGFLKASYAADGILGNLRSEGEEPEEEASYYCHGQGIITRPCFKHLLSCYRHRSLDYH
jgi:hypothetical protein